MENKEITLEQAIVFLEMNAYEGKKFCPECSDELTDVDPDLFEYCFYCGTKLY